jgi:hypothetical protein
MVFRIGPRRGPGKQVAAHVAAERSPAGEPASLVRRSSGLDEAGAKIVPAMPLGEEPAVGGGNTVTKQ